MGTRVLRSASADNVSLRPKETLCGGSVRKWGWQRVLEVFSRSGVLKVSLVLWNYIIVGDEK